MHTAYFDYMVTENYIVPQTIPRIAAWTDKLVHQYIELEPEFKKMEVMLYCKCRNG